MHEQFLKGIHRNSFCKLLMFIASRKKDRGLEWKGDLLF